MSLQHALHLVLATAVVACSVDPGTPEVEPAAAPSGPPATGGNRFDEIEPVRTRNDVPRFIDPALRSPDAAPMLLARLAARRDRPEVRAALAEAIGLTGGNYAAPIADALATETDPHVRVQMVASLARTGREQDDDEAHDVARGLRTAFADASSAVRKEAAYAAASHHVGFSLVNELTTAATDEDAAVRAAAIRALGVLAIGDELELVRQSIDDSSPEVRLEALRGLRRLDPSVARAIVASAALGSDPDPRIRRAAAGLAVGRNQADAR